MGWTALAAASSCQDEVVDRKHPIKEPSMEQVITIGLDLAKNVFQFMALTQQARSWCAGSCAAAMSGGLGGLPRCLVGMEACATAHYWARELIKLGHGSIDAAGLCQTIREAR
jgi:transposase